MSTPAACEHEWEDTEITFSIYGRRWIHGCVACYCRRCHRWGRRITMFMDGDFYKRERDARAATEEERARVRPLCRAWRAEHDPA